MTYQRPQKPPIVFQPMITCAGCGQYVRKSAHSPFGEGALCASCFAQKEASS